MTPFTVAIMAGGKSSRMGTDKSFVPLLGKLMIERVLDRVSDLGQDETIVITNRPDDYARLNLPTFADVIPGKGALGGIYTAVYRSSNEDTLIVACDMPFVNRDLLRHMVGLRGEGDASVDLIIPRVEDHPQGFHAIYRKTCLRPIRACLDADRLKVISFHDQVRARYLDPPEWMRFDPKGLSFWNINTPEELEAAQQLAASE
jgi:molybdopterin-guanine dinucleotide biosynthesis protein A